MTQIDVIIETPKGSAQKYDYDPQSHFFKLSKILPSGMVFPYDFGFIPGTKGEDGDPLDILLISEFESFPGCMITCRVVGCIQAEQTERDKKKVRNDRFIAIPEPSLLYKNIANLKELPHELLEDIQHFFINYNRIGGKEFKPLKLLNSKAAIKLIDKK